MTDAEFRAQKRRIQRLSRPWFKSLGLKWWRLTCDYARDLEEFQGTDHQEIGRSTLAYTHAQHEYLIARIVFNVVSIAQVDDEYLEEVIVHECMHILLAETRYGTSCDCSFDLKPEERVATTLARAFIWTRNFAERQARREVLSVGSLKRKAC